MIGGIDIIIPTMVGKDALEITLRVIIQLWRTPVFENAETGERYNNLWNVPVDSIKEVFVYPNTEMADAWDEEGAIPALSNTMIHVIADIDEVTVVIDEKNKQMDELLSAITSSLQDAIFLATQEKEAA